MAYGITRAFLVYASLIVAGCSQSVLGVDSGFDIDIEVARIDAPADRSDTSIDVIDPSDDGIRVVEDGSTHVCYPTRCEGHLLACGDCLDNDGDGLVDSHDPECLGACDNREGSVLEQDNGSVAHGVCVEDCFFDFGVGSANDGCRWDQRCEPNETAPEYAPIGPSCAYDGSRVGGSNCPAVQSTMCHAFCGPLTPNGCDCFGCCTSPELATAGPGGTPRYVHLGSVGPDGSSTCTLAAFADTAACRPCTPVTDCFNPCERCEVCIGRLIPPADCTPNEQCPTGVAPCGQSDQPECPFGTYCVTGCCQNVPG